MPAHLKLPLGSSAQALSSPVEFDPTHAANHEYLGMFYAAIGRYEESIAQFRKGATISGSPYASSYEAFVYARAGKIEESKKILFELKERSKKEYVSLTYLACAFGALGENDIAFDVLEKAYAARENRLTWLKIDPSFDPLRSDPRFAVLLKKVGLEE